MSELTLYQIINHAAAYWARRYELLGEETSLNNFKSILDLEAALKRQQISDLKGLHNYLYNQTQGLGSEVSADFERLSIKQNTDLIFNTSFGNQKDFLLSLLKKTSIPTRKRNKLFAGIAKERSNLNLTESFTFNGTSIQDRKISQDSEETIYELIQKGVLIESDIQSIAAIQVYGDNYDKVFTLFQRLNSELKEDFEKESFKKIGQLFINVRRIANLLLIDNGQIPIGDKRFEQQRDLFDTGVIENREIFDSERWDQIQSIRDKKGDYVVAKLLSMTPIDGRFAKQLDNMIATRTELIALDSAYDNLLSGESLSTPINNNMVDKSGSEIHSQTNIYIHDFSFRQLLVNAAAYSAYMYQTTRQEGYLTNFKDFLHLEEELTLSHAISEKEDLNRVIGFIEKDGTEIHKAIWKKLIQTSLGEEWVDNLSSLKKFRTFSDNHQPDVILDDEVEGYLTVFAEGKQLTPAEWKDIRVLVHHKEYEKAAQLFSKIPADPRLKQDSPALTIENTGALKGQKEAIAKYIKENNISLHSSSGQKPLLGKLIPQSNYEGDGDVRITHRLNKVPRSGRAGNHIGIVRRKVKTKDSILEDLSTFSAQEEKEIATKVSRYKPKVSQKDLMMIGVSGGSKSAALEKAFAQYMLEIEKVPEKRLIYITCDTILHILENVKVHNFYSYTHLRQIVKEIGVQFEEDYKKLNIEGAKLPDVVLTQKKFFGRHALALHVLGKILDIVESDIQSKYDEEYSKASKWYKGISSEGLLSATYQIIRYTALGALSSLPVLFSIILRNYGSTTGSWNIFWKWREEGIIDSVITKKIQNGAIDEIFHPIVEGFLDNETGQILYDQMPEILELVTSKLEVPHDASIQNSLEAGAKDIANSKSLFNTEDMREMVEFVDRVTESKQEGAENSVKSRYTLMTKQQQMARFSKMYKSSSFAKSNIKTGQISSRVGSFSQLRATGTDGPVSTGTKPNFSSLSGRSPLNLPSSQPSGLFHKDLYFGTTLMTQIGIREALAKIGYKGKDLDNMDIAFLTPNMVANYGLIELANIQRSMASKGVPLSKAQITKLYLQSNQRSLLRMTTRLAKPLTGAAALYMGYNWLQCGEVTQNKFTITD